MITIVTAAADREAIAFATKMARQHGLEGPTAFFNDLLNEALRQVMQGEGWSADETDAYCPRAAFDDLDDGILF